MSFHTTFIFRYSLISRFKERIVDIFKLNALTDFLLIIQSYKISYNFIKFTKIKIR